MGARVLHALTLTAFRLRRISNHGDGEASLQPARSDQSWREQSEVREFSRADGEVLEAGIVQPRR
jgi:hypothetical protein